MDLLLLQPQRQWTLATLIVAGAVVGYSVRMLQERSQHSQMGPVHRSWLAEARTCWKGFSGWTDEDILTKLGSATRFRTAFPAYASDTDDRIFQIAHSEPVLRVPSTPGWLGGKVSPRELGARIKAKYAEYDDIGDEDIARAVLNKFPVYEGMLTDDFFTVADPEDATSANQYYVLAARPCHAESGLPERF